MPDATAALQQTRPAPEWSADQQRFLAIFATRETRHLPEVTVCRLAETTLGAWHRAREDPQFVAALDALGVTTGRRRGGPPHTCAGWLAHPWLTARGRAVDTAPGHRVSARCDQAASVGGSWRL